MMHACKEQRQKADVGSSLLPCMLVAGLPPHLLIGAPGRRVRSPGRPGPVRHAAEAARAEEEGG